MAGKEKILVIGSNGQIGTELVLALREIYGEGNVFATDVREPNEILKESGPFSNLDTLDKQALVSFIQKHKITQIYQLAALLSATAEQKPLFGWQLNMDGLLNTLTAAVDLGIHKVFWPSSIAAFGPNTPRKDTPQFTIMNPNTVYGISKLAGEGWCDYFFQKKKLDVRSVRYPGLISYKSPPGGGTTDYAIDIFYKALKEGEYNCFLSSETRLPMMYMPDAIRGTIELMETPSENISVRSSYNFSAISFTPEELAASIKREIPEFQITYSPDFRQSLADSWPDSIDDSYARKDWNWKPEYDLDRMVKDMLMNIPVASV